MEIITSETHCIITPLSPKLDFHEAMRIKSEIEASAQDKVGLDLKYVKDCTIEFFEEIKFSNISLFNIPSDIFVILNIFNFDKILNLYVSQTDFIDSKRRLLNRNLTVVA